MKSTNKTILATVAVIAAILASAAAASYYTRENIQANNDVPVKHVAQQHTAPASHPQHMAQAQPAQPACNDHNVVGVVAGGAAGGILGHQLGKGAGNTAATIGGTLGGAYLGQQYIPTQNVACR